MIELLNIDCMEYMKTLDEHYFEAAKQRLKGSRTISLASAGKMEEYSL